jgi:putative FmdB family regulatory protein
MAVYEFRCRTCDEVFEVRRPMSQSGDPAPCPSGHTETVRLLSMFASVGAADGAPMPGPAGPPMGGGCCGGGCGCG